MFIAQHSVAGEGGLHPEKTLAAISTADQSALDEFIAVQSNLPWVVFRAAHRAASIPTLPARARAVLAALARTVDANRPYAAIFARRELLTGRAMQSMRTFYRSLEDLETAGFLERAPQKRYGDAGQFGRAYLHLTDRAAITLGYVAHTNTQPKEALAIPEHSTAPTARASIESHFSRPSATVADGAIYKDLFPKTQKRQPASLPVDLECLLPLGFHRFLIFKLMREAKDNAKLLSDVVEATWDHLRLAAHPISYLRKLLSSPIDFAYQNRTKREAKAVVSERAKQRAAEADVIGQAAGKAFIDSSGARLITVSGSGESISVQTRGESGCRTAIQHWQKDFVEAMASGKLAEASQLDILAVTGGASQMLTPRTVPEPGNAPSFRTMTSDIQTRLLQMKTMLRATCAGITPVSLT